MTTPTLTTSQLGRRVPSDQELSALIGSALTSACQARRTFSAYEITVELRRANPSLEIAHDRSRDVIHQAMNQAIAQGLYDAQHGQYITYVPVTTPTYTPPVVAAPGPAQSPQAPATPAASVGGTAPLSGLPLLPVPGQS